MCSLLYTHLLGRLEELAVTGMGVSAATPGGESVVLPFVHARRRRLSTRKTRSACRYRNGGFRGRAGGRERDVRAYIIFVTVILPTGLMSSPVPQNAMPSHMIIEMGLWGASAGLSPLKPVPVSVPAS